MPENSKPRISRKKQSLDPTSHLGKLPPQAIELEEAVLGALMLEKDALTNVIDDQRYSLLPGKYFLNIS